MSLLFRLEFSAHLHQVDGVGHNILCFLYHRSCPRVYAATGGENGAEIGSGTLWKKTGSVSKFNFEEINF